MAPGFSRCFKYFFYISISFSFCSFNVADKMENENIEYLKSRVGFALDQKILDLESIKTELELEVKTTEGEEQERNINLLIATVDLLNQLKKTRQNIDGITS
jgi:hypothetical protein